jgi:SecD/SecF fusion protein
VLQLFRDPAYDFIGKRRWTYAFSGLLVLVCLASLAVQGLRYDIDFTGGTLIQVRVEFVGPQVGRDLQRQAIDAVLIGLAGVLAYVALGRSRRHQ